MSPWLVAYLSFTAVLVITPGSTTAVVVRNTLAGGRAAGLSAAVGAAVGNTSHAIAAGLGLAMVFSRWPVLLTALKIGGASYLAWLGINSLYRVVMHADGGLRMLGAESDSPAADRRGSFRQGLTVNLLSPAIATFYLLVVPSFLPSRAPAWYFAGLAAAHIAMAMTCHGIWAVALDHLRVVFHPSGARRTLAAATGLALLYLAGRILVGA